MAQSNSPFKWPGTQRAAVSLSFDDARPSQLENGLAIFDKYQIRATFYVLPERLTADPEPWRMAAAKGHEIGSHSLSHPCTGNFAFARGKALESFTIEKMRYELEESKRRIKDITGKEPVTFAYPCGQTFIGRGQQVQSYVPLVAECYLAGRLWLSEDSNDPAFCDLAQVLAVELDGLSFNEMQALVDKAAAEGKWLVFAGHDIGAEGRQTTIVSELDKLCSYLSEMNDSIWLDTVENVAAYVQSHRP